MSVLNRQQYIDSLIYNISASRNNGDKQTVNTVNKVEAEIKFTIFGSQVFQVVTEILYNQKIYTSTHKNKLMNIVIKLKI